MIYWIDIAHGQTGTRYGTIRTATGLETSTLLDRAGSFRFALAAGDPQIDLLQVRRTAHAWAIVDDQVTELGAGVIEEISIAGDGAPSVAVTGSDLLRELAWQNVGDLWLADEVTEHAARVWFLDSGTPVEVAQATDFQEGDTTTWWQVPGEQHIWVPVEDGVGDFLYVAHLRQFDTIYFKRGPTGPGGAHYGSAYPEWHVQYYNSADGWTDLTLTEQSSLTGTNTGYDEKILLGQSGTLAWEMPDDWALQNPTYEVRIWFSGADTEIENIEIADIAVGYTKPTADALARIMGYAPTGWSLDAGSGYIATQPAETMSSELLSNGDLETITGTPDDGVTDSFTGWTNAGVDANNRLEATATAHGGSIALKIVAAVTATPILSQTVSVTAQKEYTLTFWTQGDATAEALYRISDAVTGWTLTGWHYTGATAATWVQVTRRFAIPPAVTSIELELSATAGIAYIDDVSLLQVTAGEVYLELAGESRLEALNRLAEQTGEHFIRGTGRTVRWLGFDERRLDLWLSNGGDANAKQSNPYAGHIVRLTEQQDGYELVSRIYVYGGSLGDQRVTLATCTRTPPTGYTLNVAENYIERSGVDYRRTDKLLELSDIMPYDLSATALADAANALFDRALNWLQTHSATDTHRLTGDQPRAYMLEVAGCERIIQPGYLVRVTYLDAADTHIMQHVDGWLWVLGASLRIDANGVPIWTLQTATVDALARTEAEAQWTEARINRAIRRRGSLPLTASGGGIIIGGGVSDHAGLTNLAYANSGHTGFQPTLAVSDTASIDLTLTGATLSAAVLPAGVDHGGLAGLADDDHTGYLLATGARTGASAQAQTFTNGIIGPSWKPAADSTTALQIQNAAGTAIVNADTTNSQLGVGIVPITTFHVSGKTPVVATDFIALFTANGVTPEASAILTATLAGRTVSVQGAGSAYFMGRDVTNDIEFVMGTSSAGVAFAGSLTAHNLQLRVNNLTSITIQTGTRYVGILNTSPGLELDVTGGISISANSFFGGGSNSRGIFFNAIGAYTYGILRTSGGDLALRSNVAVDTQFAIQAATGLISIGTASFAARLNVLGTTDIQQLLVTGHTTQAVGTGLVNFTRNDTAAGVSQMLTLTALGSGANGDGGSIVMLGKTSTTVAQAMARVAYLWSDATHVSRKANLVLYASDSGGEREIFRGGGTGTAGALAFYGGTLVARGAALTTQLTTITHTAPGTPDYAIQALTDSGGFGFVTADEGHSVLAVIANLQARCAELEARLNAATGCNLIA